MVWPCFKNKSNTTLCVALTFSVNSGGKIKSNRCREICVKWFGIKECLAWLLRGNSWCAYSEKNWYLLFDTCEPYRQILARQACCFLRGWKYPIKNFCRFVPHIRHKPFCFTDFKLGRCVVNDPSKTCAYALFSVQYLEKCCQFSVECFILICRSASC